MDISEIADQLLALVTTYGLNVIFALLIFFIGWWISKIITGSLRKILTARKVDATLTSFVASLSYGFLLLFVIIAALGRLGIQTASLVALLGAAGLAVGLALQGSLSNFASGVLIIILRPFKIGDYIEGGGTAGTVEDIGMFMTNLKTPDNKKVIVPNTNIMGGNITNYTAKDMRRLDLIFGVSYHDDIHEVEAIIRELLDSHELVLKDPAYIVGILALADSSVNFAVRPWVKTSDYWTLYYDLHARIKDAFDAKGISIPFPQQDVHLHTVEKTEK